MSANYLNMPLGLKMDALNMTMRVNPILWILKIWNIFKLIGFIFVLCGCVNINTAKYGVQDAAAAVKIVRANELAMMRSSGRYEELAKKLNADLSRFSLNDYALVRIKNELAELYSYQLLDIELAIGLDEDIIISNIPNSDTVGNFLPTALVANQQIISDQKYLNDYLSAKSGDILGAARQRLSRNRILLDGSNKRLVKNYELDFLRHHLVKVNNDIKNTPIDSASRYRILSRLVRAEYEIRVKDPTYKFKSIEYFNGGRFDLNRIDLTEIDYISLADYFINAFRDTGDAKFAENALDIIYKPYINLRNPLFRWRYNKLINEYISELIEANYELKRFDELLYYTSLNKSRMLLEERLAFGSGKSKENNVADLMFNDGILRTNNGLPHKEWFKNILADSVAYLDFYVGGKYESHQGAGFKMGSSYESSIMPLTTRDFGVESAAIQNEYFFDDVLYITQVENGKVVRVNRLTGSKLTEVKYDLNSSYNIVSNPNSYGESRPIDFFQILKREANLPKFIKVSPDKWISKHPLDFHLGTKVTRSVNFFTDGSSGKISTLKILGFFNPTLDLAGAEQEADAIISQFPQAKIYKRELASIEALKSADTAPLLHFSMHGQFNSTDPKYSRLVFSGATRGVGVLNDPNSLYAKDMYQYNALTNRELIFAAACQTGLSSADRTNENELMGILRPLTAGRNKNIILSLWKVDDTATKEFVTAFYQQLASTKDIAESFHFAQDQVRSKYIKPYYWAAFYLSQAR
jgi:CHAT domain